MDTLDEVNVMLLRNMLPKHVADHYTHLMHKGAISDNVRDFGGTCYATCLYVFTLCAKVSCHH